MPDPSNTEAEGTRVIGICQNPEGPQPWFQADSTDEKCPEPYCDCEPKFYVALRSAASSSTPEARVAAEDVKLLREIVEEGHLGAASPVLARVLDTLESRAGTTRSPYSEEYHAQHESLIRVLDTLEGGDR